MRDPDQSRTPRRRSVLKTIGAGSVGVVFGGSAISTVAVERDHQREDGAHHSKPIQPEPKELSKPGGVDPHNPREVVWVQNLYSKSDGKKRKAIIDKLDAEQQQALWDAYKPAFRTIISGSFSGELPRNTPVEDMKQMARMNITSTSSSWSRKDIGDKWGWFDEL